MPVVLALGLKLFGGALVTAGLGFLGKELHSYLTAKATSAHSRAGQDVLDFVDTVAMAVLGAAPAALQGDLTKAETYESALKTLGTQALNQAQASSPALAGKLADDLPALLDQALRNRAAKPTPGATTTTLTVDTTTAPAKQG